MERGEGEDCIRSATGIPVTALFGYRAGNARKRGLKMLRNVNVKNANKS